MPIPPPPRHKAHSPLASRLLLMLGIMRSFGMGSVPDYESGANGIRVLGRARGVER